MSDERRLCVVKLHEQLGVEHAVKVRAESNRGRFSDSERFISTCNDLQERGRYPKSLQDSLRHRYCVP